MNTSRLSSIVKSLLDAASRHRVAKLLGAFQSSLNNLAANPADPATQTALANSLKNLADAYYAMQEEFEPTHFASAEEIGGRAFFVDDIPSILGSLVQSNSATPAVAKETVDKFVREFGAFVDTLTHLSQRLDAIGVAPLDLKDGQPELGILLPRNMFDNHLDEMIRELRNINRILRAFSELELGAPEPVEVRSISTTDPLFGFGMALPVVFAVAKTVKWALGVWKDVEDIRLVRAQTSQIKSFKEAEVEAIFGKKIKEEVELAVDDKLKELFSKRPKDGKSRDNELKQEIKFSLEYILAGIERGLTIEVRHLPLPPETEIVDIDAVEKPITPRSIAVIAKQLSFPSVDPTQAVLSLPAPPESPTANSESSTRRK